MIAVLAILTLAVTPMSEAAETEVTCVKQLPATRSSGPYVFNREPLTPTSLAKLPIGAIRPHGWLEEQLNSMADGMVGRLAEISPFISTESGWNNPSKPGWEELPYWLKGFGDLGYILGSSRIKRESSKWIDRVIATQDESGYFGPVANKTNRDLWPNMVVLYALQSLYEATGDSRVLPFMTRYFSWQNSLPIEDLLPESWQKVRGGDNLESIYWLYNRTGDEFLLELAEKIHKRTVNWTGEIASFHGVNFCQGFREPAVYYQQSRDKSYLQATRKRYDEMMGRFGRVPGGMFAADENARDGHSGPQQGAETCSMVEYMNSFESLLRITGDPAYADKAEEVAFNSLPASATPGWSGIHYLTAPNQVILHKGGEHIFQNQGRMVSYSAGTVYRCCQHNVSHGWPYFAEHLWMATADDGLAAIFYADCDVTAQVSGGVKVRISERTDYPFGETIRLTIDPDKAARFPISLRIPSWCKSARVSVNGVRQRVKAEPGSYLVIPRTWHAGDRVELELPMKITVEMWPEHGNAVSVRRGPLWYSLAIKENWSEFVEDQHLSAWPDHEVLPGSDWNYGLVAEGRSFRFEQSDAMPDQPFGVGKSPVRIVARGRKLPQWKLDKNSPASPPASPVEANSAVEDITLIPMGASRIRISVFPTVEP